MVLEIKTYFSKTYSPTSDLYRHLTLQILRFILTSAALTFFLAAANTDYWQQFVHYNMNVRLDDENRKLEAHSTIKYVNKSPDILDRVYLHLYPNAFQEGSVKHREYINKLGRRNRALKFIEDIKDYESKVDISELKLEMSSGLLTEKFEVDDTILKIMLPGKLQPEDSLVLDFDWTHHVGKQFERAGYVKGQYNMAQWYPKLVVYDEKGWHAHPFHAEGEFYGEFGTFDVTLDLPEKFIVGATGMVESGDPGWESTAYDTSLDYSDWLEEFEQRETNIDSAARRVVSFHAEEVHDFAWIASPNFVYEHGIWNGIDVHILYNSSRGEKWSTVVRERSERALEWLSEKFGMYPYPQVTVTDRLKGGGMEYPMLVMNGSESEGLIVHEIGHIWFYGILGNNEIDEAWMDEGFTTFQTRWYLTDRYGPHGFDMDGSERYKPYQKKRWKFSSSLGRDQWSTIGFMTSGFDEPVSRTSYLYDNGSAYRYNAYTKPSLMLDELQYILGDSLFDKVMQTYYDRWKLKHVNEDRFVSIVEEVTGQELDWFFDAWLHDTQLHDAAIKGWKSVRLDNGNWENQLVIKQKGNRYLPHLVEARFNDGTKYRTWWKNHLWRKTDVFTFQTTFKPSKLILDPDSKTVDADRRNNQTGRMGTYWSFNWPGMNYNPRDKRVGAWKPTVYYHDKDGLIPGIELTSKYGPWASGRLTLNAGIESGKVYWSYGGSFRPVHARLNVKTKIKVFDQGSVRGMGGTVSKTFRKAYGLDPTTIGTLKFNVTETVDDIRTDLYDKGTVGTFSVNILRKNNKRSVSVDYATTLGGISDWSFSRMTAVIKNNRDIGKFDLNGRLIAGTMWSDKLGVPVQERFTIEGAGSGDVFSMPYLRDKSSFFGAEDLRGRYHLPGDANLRGFYGKEFSGTEKLITTSMEMSYKLPLSFVNINTVLFSDAGVFWGSRNKSGDHGFDGDILADAGVGLRMSKSVVGYRLFFRLDVPFLLYIDNQTHTDTNRWVFSFQNSL